MLGKLSVHRRVVADDEIKFAVTHDPNRAAALDTQNADIFNNRGNTYRALGQYKAALTDYGRTIILDPTDPVAYNGRGNTYSSLGQCQQALLCERIG